MVRKPKSKSGEILADTLFSLRVRKGADWYAVVTARWADPLQDPIVAVAGPFDVEAEAQEFYGKSIEFMVRGGGLVLPDLATVPQDIRRELTAEMRRGWQPGGQFERLRSWKGGEDLPVDLSPRH